MFLLHLFIHFHVDRLNVEADQSSTHGVSKEFKRQELEMNVTACIANTVTAGHQEDGFDD